EGLRRMDQGIPPPNPFPNGNHASHAEKKTVVEMTAVPRHEEAPRPKAPVPSAPTSADVQAFGVLSSQSNPSKFQSRRWGAPAVVGAIVVLVAVVGVPWGWYARSKAKQSVSVPDKVVENTQVEPAPLTAEAVASPTVETPESNLPASADTQAAKRLAEAKARE